VSDTFTVSSHRGPYRVEFEDRAFNRLASTTDEHARYIVDAKVARLYESDLRSILEIRSTLLIEATESAKSLHVFAPYVDHLVANGMRRGDRFVAIGGGIIQDITAFLAATFLRGLDWEFYPTTLLAQADSCIGSKSSINVGSSKNILGTYTPPTRVVIDLSVLSTLETKDLRSGIGEILKVHAIEGPEAFDRVSRDYDRLFQDPVLLKHYILESLRMKRHWIELDEFDRGPRNILNFGHSFGHALESATDFAIPHGIAVTLGMDMAVSFSVELGRVHREHYDRMHPVLAKNFSGFRDVPIPVGRFLEALGKDKKNVGTSFKVVLLGADGKPEIAGLQNDRPFQDLANRYLLELPRTS